MRYGDRTVKVMVNVDADGYWTVGGKFATILYTFAFHFSSFWDEKSFLLTYHN